jgi:AraC-like DNA-binding protein
MGQGSGATRLRAWAPAVTGIAEVFYAQFVEHAYPAHTHATWMLLVVDSGAIRFDLGCHHRGAARGTVALLPPHLRHGGAPTTSRGFSKRVLYLDDAILDDELIGRSVDQPSFDDPDLRVAIHRLHNSLAHPADTFEAETRLAFVAEQLHTHLGVAHDHGSSMTPNTAADLLRQLLDAHTTEGITLARAATERDVAAATLARAFTRAFGLPPHAYLIGRRVELARR